MKKLLSLILALAIFLCCLTPVGTVAAVTANISTAVRLTGADH